MPKWRVIKDTGARPVGDVFELDRETMNHEFFERVDEPEPEPEHHAMVQTHYNPLLQPPAQDVKFEVATPRRGRPAKNRGE